jgi:3-oxoacyl-[acyl-carrier protein] reductase
MLVARNADALARTTEEARRTAASSGGIAASTGGQVTSTGRQAAATGGVESIALDLTEEEAPDRLREAVRAAYGRVDLLVNNAGTAKAASFRETDLALLRQHLRINLEVPFVLTRTLLPLLQRAARGDEASGDVHDGEAVIVNLASVVAHKGYVGQSAYGASKHALLGFTKAAAKELGELGVRMHVVSPGGTATDMIRGVRPDLDPDGLIQPSAVAKAVRFLYELGDNAVVDEIQLRRAGGAPFS